MATSSYWAGNSYAKDSIRPAQTNAFVRTSGTTATPRHPEQQQNRAPDRRSVHIPPLLPPNHTTEDLDDTPKQQRTPFLFVVLVVVLVCSALWGTKVLAFDPWWQSVQNQIHYGDSKMGSAVLQLTGDTTLNNVISFIRTDPQTHGAYLIVIDVQPGKKPQQLTKFIDGPSATNQTITTITSEDYNSDGKTDVVIHIQNSPVTFALLNDGQGNLSWATP